MAIVEFLLIVCDAEYQIDKQVNFTNGEKCGIIKYSIKIIS